MSASAIVAVVAAVLAVGGAVAAVLTTRRARERARTLEEELERGKAAFDEIVQREIAVRATELEQTLKLARAQSLSLLVDEERRITESRRRDVAERERDASTRLAEKVTEAERRVDERIAQWGADLEQLQESLAAEFARL